MTILAVAAAAGDDILFANLLARYLAIGQRLAYAMLRNEDEAADAVQDAALNAWRARQGFNPGSEFRPWFLTIVANQCRQRRRSRWWSVLRMASLPEAESAFDDSRLSPDELRSALRRIPVDRRLVLVLRYYLDLSFEEIGQILKCSAQAAKSRTRRALAELRIEVPEE